MNNKRSAARQGCVRVPRGYSVLELMLTVAVASVVTAVSVPTFSRLALDNQRSAIVNELLASLLLARSEAVKRGQIVVVCGVSDSNQNGALDPVERHCAGRVWTDGWMLGTWNDANNDETVDPAELTPLREHFTGATGGFTVTAGNFTASPPVAPAGTAVMKSFSRRSSNGTVTICDRRGPREARAVIVSPNGRARVSSKRADGSALTCP